MVKWEQASYMGKEGKQNTLLCKILSLHNNSSYVHEFREDIVGWDRLSVQRAKVKLPAGNVCQNKELSFIEKNIGEVFHVAFSSCSILVGYGKEQYKPILRVWEFKLPCSVLSI